MSKRIVGHEIERLIQHLAKVPGLFQCGDDLLSRPGRLGDQPPRFVRR